MTTNEAINHERSALHRLEETFDVDVDSIDPNVARAMPFKPHNRKSARSPFARTTLKTDRGSLAVVETSNQFIVGQALTLPENEELVRETIDEFRSEGWEYILDRISVRLCRRNIPNIQGRVLLQTSPRFAYDTQGTLRHAHQFAQIFQEEGISRDRFCLKIPATGPGMVASHQLNAEGVRTLGTMIFSLPQAIAASQAGCWAVSPYYNELAAILDPSLHIPYSDPLTQHPMSYRIRQMVETYTLLARTTGRGQPGIVVAAMTTPAEVRAVAELQCSGATLFPHLLSTLAQTPAGSLAPAKPRGAYSYTSLGPTPDRLKGLSLSDPLAGSATTFDPARDLTGVDYLAQDGTALDRAVREDGAARERLGFAIRFFVEAEEGARGVLEGFLGR